MIDENEKDSSMVNLYELLGLSIDATENQIRQHIMQHHSAGTLDEKILETAKKWLLNTDIRKQYDAKLLANITSTPPKHDTTSQTRYSENQQTNINLSREKKSLGWFLAILFIFMTISLVSNLKLSQAIVGFILVLLVLPPVRIAAYTKYNRTVTPKLRFLAILLGLILITVTGTEYKELTPAEKEQRAINDVKRRIASAKRESTKKPVNSKQFEANLNFMSMDFVKATLKDPNSAKFRNQVKFCGEVNAKNSFGAYNGFIRYAAPNKELVLFDNSDNAEDIDTFNRVWNELCLGKK